MVEWFLHWSAKLETRVRFPHGPPIFMTKYDLKWLKKLASKQLEEDYWSKSCTKSIKRTYSKNIKRMESINL